MTLVPVHPEAGADAHELRWVVPADVLGFVGRPAAVPDALARLVGGGVLTGITVEPGAVVLRLAEGRSWREEGPAVRAALQAALAEPAGWLPVSDAAASGTARLRAAAEAVLAGEVGDYIRSHAGTAEIVSVAGDRVAVSLGGACTDCPARRITLALRVETALRRLYPDLAGVDLRER